ncbi:MAG: tyrosine-type recombinase/integrase [Desulfovibrionaceae bacterium]|nr:tyrosine-type recombinase/integrase [Desulfovibrionaceae bacterium]
MVLFRSIPPPRQRSNATCRHDRKICFFTNNGSPISEAGTPFRRVVKKCGFNAGISDRRNRVVFHTLRHTFASWLVQNGTPLMVVGDILGHRSITMTQRMPPRPQPSIKKGAQRCTQSHLQSGVLYRI